MNHLRASTRQALAAMLALAMWAPAVQARDVLSVYAASSLRESMEEIARAFETEHPGVRVEVDFAGTSTLRTQIEHGARADVLAAADTVHTAALRTRRRIEDPVVFAHNRLALIVRRDWIVPPASLGMAQSLVGGGGAPGAGDSPGGAAGAMPDRSPEAAARNVLQTLLRARTRIVLADSTVPAGRYAARALAKMSRDPRLGPDFARRFSEHVASRETNVRAVLAKVALGEADAGIVYTTDAATEPERVRVTAIPDAWNVTADYSVAVVRGTRHRALAESFVKFMLAPRAGAILRRHGFQGPP